MKSYTYAHENISYEVKSTGNSAITAKHKTEYMYICPKCGRFTEVETMVKVKARTFLDKANIKDMNPLEEDPKIYVVPPEGISLTCPCGCGMISVDKISAVYAFKLRDKFGFENIALSDPISETGMNLNPTELYFMDPIGSLRMQKLIHAIMSIENSKILSEHFRLIVARACNDERARSVPVYMCNADFNEYTYIEIKELSTTDTVRFKSTSTGDIFSQYVDVLIQLMEDKFITDIEKDIVDTYF